MSAFHGLSSCPYKPQYDARTKYTTDQVSFYSTGMLSGLWESSLCHAEVQSGKEAGPAGCTRGHGSTLHSARMHSGTLIWIFFNVVEHDFKLSSVHKDKCEVVGKLQKVWKVLLPCLSLGRSQNIWWYSCFSDGVGVFFTSRMSHLAYLLSCRILYSFWSVVRP